MQSVILPVLLLSSLLQSVFSYRGTDQPTRIDCGSSSGTTVNGRSWMSDKYSQGGKAFNISTATASGLTLIEASLRAFPAATANKPGCYKIPVPKGRYLVRLGFSYYNYDGLNQPPYFNILVQNTVVETLDMVAVASRYTTGAYYSDYIAYALNAKVSVCFAPFGGTSAPPIVNTLEILPVDTDAYDSNSLGQDVILSTYVRINMGGPQIDAEPADPGFRTWLADVSPVQGNYTPLTAGLGITGTGKSPDYLPESLFQSAREAAPPFNATGFRMSLAPVNMANLWYIRFYFAELDNLLKAGDRVFNILLGSGSVFEAIGDQKNGFDILAAGLPLDATVVPVFFNYTKYTTDQQDLEVGVKTSNGSAEQAIINGVELFEIIKANPNQDDGGGGMSAGAIIGIILGVLAGLALIAAAVWFFVLRKKGGSGAGTQGITFANFGATSSERSALAYQRHGEDNT